MKPVRTWILIADGARARVVMNDGPGHGIKSVEGMDFRTKNSSNHSDEPGRVHDRKGPGRHSMEPHSDANHEEHKKFAGELGQRLYEKLNDNAYDRMIIFASPSMLGELRSSLSPRVMDKVIEQVPKDLTHLPNKELSKHLESVLAV